MTTTSKKFTSTVAGASILLSGVGLVSKGLGMIREMIFAGSFGLGEEFDIYLVGAVLPLTIQVVIFFLIQNFFIPTYNDLINENPDEKESFVRSNFWIFGLGGLLLALILFLLSEVIIGLYLSASSIEKQESARLIFNLFLITLPFSSANSILISGLQNDMNFLKPAIAKLSTNLAVIAVVFTLSNSYGTVIIPIGYIIGEILQMFVLVHRLHIKLISFNERLILRHHLRSSLSLSFFMIVVIESLSQLYAVSDRYFIKSVEEGGIAALNYAQTVFLLPISIISVALSTAIFPKLSQGFSSGLFDQLERDFNSGMKINILLFIPIMFLFLFYGGEIIQIIFQRGKFEYKDTLLTAANLKYFAISLVFYSLYSMNNKMIYSARMIKSLLVITVLGIILKILLNFILVKDLMQNGLALSSSISYTFFFIASFFALKRKLAFLSSGLLVKELVLHSLSAIFAYFIITLLLNHPGNMIESLMMFLFFVAMYLLNLMILEAESFKLVRNLMPNLGKVKIFQNNFSDQ